MSASGQASGYATPFRGTLSTVPSSILLNVELEGNISEAALQRLAMIECSTAAGRPSSGHIDAADASLASMFGISSWAHPHHPQQQQQQQQQQDRMQLIEEPPTEAECRLAYVSVI
jgi:hypothetical protein